MDYFWKENKKFVTVVGAIALGVFLYRLFVLSPLNGAADADTRKLQQEQRSLQEKMAQGVASEETLTQARRDRDLNRKFLASLVQETACKLPDKFRTSARESAKVHYDGLREDLRDDLRKQAVAARMEFPKSLGVSEDSTNENAPDLLLRLAVVERLTALAIESGVEKIETIDAQQGLESDGFSGSGKKKSSFLGRHPVFIKFSGKADAVFKLLHGAQKKGTYLAVTHFEFTRPDPSKETFEAAMAVALLSVDEKAPLEVK